MGLFKKYVFILAAAIGGLTLYSCDGGDTLFLRNDSNETVTVTLFHHPTVTAAGDTLPPSFMPLMDKSKSYIVERPGGIPLYVIPERDTARHTVSFVVSSGSQIVLIHKIGFSGGDIEEWGFNAIGIKSKHKDLYYEGNKMLGLTSHSNHSMGLHDYYINVGASPE